MTERIDERLTDALTRRAASVTATRIASDEVVVAGRAARRRRRFAAVSTVAAGITAAAVAVAMLTAPGRPDSAVRPGETGGPPTQSAPAPSTVTPGQLGLYVVSRNVIVRPDGSRVTLPFGDGVVDVAQAKNGWVVIATLADAPALLYVPNSGQPVLFGRISGNFKVSRDGTLLVATGVDEPSNVDVYRLPGAQRIRRTTFDSGMGPQVAGIVGDRVVLNGAQGSPGASIAAVWNVSTGQLSRTTVEVAILGVARDGRVLRRLDWLAPGGSKELLNACVDVVAMTDTLPTGETGYCPAQWMGEPRGSLSPSGDWAAVVITGEPGDVKLVRSADLHEKGQLSAVPMQLSGRMVPEFWDTDESYIAWSRVTQGEYVRCTVAGICTQIKMWTDLPVQRLLPPMN